MVIELTVLSTSLRGCTVWLVEFPNAVHCLAKRLIFKPESVIVAPTIFFVLRIHAMNEPIAIFETSNTFTTLSIAFTISFVALTKFLRESGLNISEERTWSEELTSLIFAWSDPAHLSCSCIAEPADVSAVANALSAISKFSSIAAPALAWRTPNNNLRSAECSMLFISFQTAAISLSISYGFL